MTLSCNFIQLYGLQQSNKKITMSCKAAETPSLSNDKLRGIDSGSFHGKFIQTPLNLTPETDRGLVVVPANLSVHHLNSSWKTRRFQLFHIYYVKGWGVFNLRGFYVLVCHITLFWVSFGLLGISF